ncbi:MAG: hypothetical protein ACI8W8_003208 [Rhodothermales bacterium]
MRTSQKATSLHLFLGIALCANFAIAELVGLDFDPLPSLGGGVSDLFFGASNGALMVAGGLSGASADWVVWEQHSLPNALNAAAATTDGQTMYYPGGPALEWVDSTIKSTAMPPLPRAFEKGGATILGDTLYFVDGKTSSFGSESSAFNDAMDSLSLDAPEAWVRLPDSPPYPITFTYE